MARFFNFLKNKFTNGYISPFFFAIITKGLSFFLLLFDSLDDETFPKMKFPLKGKNLLQEEQILSFKR